MRLVMYKERLGNVVRVLNDLPKLLTVEDLDNWATCLLGHIWNDEWFNSQGLIGDERNEAIYLHENGLIFEGYEAVEEFFNISEKSVYYLFSQYAYFDKLLNEELEYEMHARLQQVLDWETRGESYTWS